MAWRREGRSPGRVGVCARRTRTSQHRPRPATPPPPPPPPPPPCAGGRSSRLPPLPQHLRLSLRRRQHRPSSGPSQRLSPQPATSRGNPTPPRPRFRPPFPGAFPASSTSESPLSQGSALLPESASCVACVPPCWPLRPVPSDVEVGGGSGNIARARRGAVM